MPDGVNSNQTVNDPAAAPVPGLPLSEAPPRAANPAGPADVQRRETTAETRPPVNLRFSVPFFGKRFYFTLIGGRERRGHERIALERRRNPIRTRTNLAFIFIGAMVLYMLTLGAFLVYAAVIEM
jgi:hypothetical protein